MHGEVLSACRKALEINPTYPEAFDKMGQAYMSMGRLDKAHRGFQKSIALRPNFPLAHFNLGLPHE
jgi:Flp pilus assembly protein TadD